METGIFKSAKSYTPLIVLYELLGSCLMTYCYSLGSQSSGVRASAYLIGWIIASTLSGAHFNPAVSIAVYIYERKKAYTKYLIFIIIAQLIGSLLGIFIAYMLAKYHKVDLYPALYVLRDGDLLYFSDVENGDIYYGRVFLLEFLSTFNFIFVLLILKYKENLKRVEDPIKGIAAALTLYVCYEFTCGSGGCLNPWFGIAESLLYYG